MKTLVSKLEALETERQQLLSGGDVLHDCWVGLCLVELPAPMLNRIINYGVVNPSSTVASRGICPSRVSVTKFSPQFYGHVWHDLAQ